MKIVLLGCGRSGSQLARWLHRAGHEVSVIDKNRDAFARLGNGFTGEMVGGLGIDMDILRKAGIEGADVFLALSGGDNTNIMASQIAKMVFNVPRVITRIVDPLREKAYRQLGLDTYPSTTINAGLLLNHLLGKEPDYVQVETALLEAFDGEPKEPAGGEK